MVQSLRARTRAFFYVLAALFLSSCQGGGCVQSSVDGGTFKYFGKTVFADPQRATLDQVYLNDALFVGKDLIFEGTLDEWDRYFTHALFTDDKSKILVLLTQIVTIPATWSSLDPRTYAESSKSRLRFEIWGKVERSRRGVPFVAAKFLRLLDDGSSVPL
ncbi:MAG: hypothetical protein KA436_08930 [Oligoflexales bacterium]|nr:hypothetical protein [Oligoflexales bacterium]